VETIQYDKRNVKPIIKQGLKRCVYTVAQKGVWYYRLKIVDKDGASSYSKIVSCELSVVNKQFTVYPNPAKSSVTVRGNHIASVQVIDNMGRVVKVVLLRDATNPVLSVSGLRAGVYHLRVQTMDGEVSGVAIVVSD